MVFDTIKKIIADQLGIDADGITMETNFKDDLNADSLDLFQIINDIEDEYGVTVDDIEGIATVADAVKVVESRKE